MASKDEKLLKGLDSQIENVVKVLEELKLEREESEKRYRDEQCRTENLIEKKHAFIINSLNSKLSEMRLELNIKDDKIKQLLTAQENLELQAQEKNLEEQIKMNQELEKNLEEQISGAEKLVGETKRECEKKLECCENNYIRIVWEEHAYQVTRIRQKFDERELKLRVELDAERQEKELYKELFNMK